jgi:hypothetical protein
MRLISAVSGVRLPAPPPKPHWIRVLGSSSACVQCCYTKRTPKMNRKGPLRRSQSYLILSKFGYRFRLSVPQDLRALVGKTEFRYSLLESGLSSSQTKRWRSIMRTLRTRSSPTRLRPLGGESTGTMSIPRCGERYCVLSENLQRAIMYLSATGKADYLRIHARLRSSSEILMMGLSSSVVVHRNRICPSFHKDSHKLQGYKEARSG